MKTHLEVGGVLAPSSSAKVYPRTTDQAPTVFHGGKSVKIGADGSVTIDGLVEWGAYWLVGEDDTGTTRHVRFDAQGQATDLADEIAQRSAAAQELTGTTDGAGHFPVPNDRPSDVPKHNWEKTKTGPESNPRAKYVDVSGPQRQGADIGTAYPVDPNEIQPQPGRQHVKDVPQRQGADVGYADPVDPDEQQPAKRYEDEKGKQRLGADTGQAEPLPKTRSRRAQEEVKDSSLSKAKGVSVPKAGTTKGKGKAASPIKASAKTNKQRAKKSA